MVIKTIIPSSDNHTVEIPEAFFGKTVEVVFREMEDKTEGEAATQLDAIINRYSKFPKTDGSKHPFNRLEANNFD